MADAASVGRRAVWHRLVLPTMLRDVFHVTDDVRIAGLRPLISPAILMEDLPLSKAAVETVVQARQAATRIVEGEDDRLLVVVGPCSIHDTQAALDYGRLLQSCAARLASELLVVMRVYFEKPRTTVGWKGLINDPTLDGRFAVNLGLRQARRLLLDLAELGVPAGTEFLDTITPQFIADLISWGAIGARTTESQVHRELASGLSMPVGFKNGTDGNVKIAADAVRAAQHPHRFLSVTKQGISAIVATKGNDACHIILRGAQDGPNYESTSLQNAVALLQTTPARARVMVDCSHGNSRKSHTRQAEVALELAQRLAAGEEPLFGLMLESNLVAGNQQMRDREALTYGQSITDACMGWETTVPILEALASAVQTRRERRGATAAAETTAGATTEA